MISGYSLHYTIAPPPNQAVKLRQVSQMSVLANILSFWNNVELVLELAIQQKLALSLEQICIVCGPLGSGAKLELFQALFKDDPDRSEFVAAVKAFQGHVSRNWLAHGFIIFDQIDGPWDIVHREVKNGLKVKSKQLISYMNDEFLPAFDRVMSLSGFSDQDVHDYALSIRSLAQAK